MKLERKISRNKYILFGSAGLLVFLSVWSLLTYTGLVPAFFLPPPSKVLSAIADLLIKGNLLGDIFASSSRIFFGFLLSLVVALPIGIALGISRKFEAFIEPIIAFIRYIPPSAFIPLAIIWFGIGELEKVTILFMGIAPYLTLLIADVVINSRRDLVEAALTLGADHQSVILKVILPNCFPGIWDSLRIMMGAAWTFVIIAEIVGASAGLGHLMIESQRFLRTDNIFGGIVVIGFLGLTTDYFFKVTYKSLFKWTEKSNA
ncbi:MAG: hypothetical protein A3J07_00895 [Candidatus Doudnabacteria bacterium RIFCSPLOWO2_02_FULL_49_13]|uniref:ABC transmembrane type-1 domain-containing protein n=1 Tax=Candidatus Doudnabacteria bacterium RIFCSPHIGHO2_12_FULL_48_16 TaxID=1817838 RepID=A0A1F5PK40_9BACT|nr:MAG: hypothetical protein A3B77_04460 [Candidatus Doudnabacteria bacterium RIFCSPHIGHO2_02_FULL_49_24]OGE89907.1 MAG: hypothetical protein A2760_04355 [Candidatus Doudnabacteria bacterium RIFCSPHIGHO2_01_FULL_50_67]OGE90308.1 MAG: hypothetical protein A3E29_04405 [Candidatus Doudnabacteria bacterium RIFCSPHIGHO2_12_FULL_48_16]OGE96736.1 MAG: hypothetical protein A2990_00395 [Candidatus Doudnabacteria bacterium RIFCSPLOWO2_01_FULL_49_40]OGF02364.1 MAG: hypothetical protein A3J07_00895 [Candid